MKNKIWQELIGILITFGLLYLFSIGSNAEKIIICLLGLIYWRLNLVE